MTVIYGIPNCDKCRSARKWFDAAGIKYIFHDLRTDGLSRTMVNGWLARAGVATLINTRSTTWRRLSNSERRLLDQNAASLLLQHPTLLKRPLVDDGTNMLVGYDETLWKAVFN